MQVQGATQTWTFQSPLTLELDVTRAMFQGLGEGVFRIFNLNESTRRDIYQDWNDQGSYRQVILRAGYRSWATVYGPPNPNGVQNLQSLPLIFSGNIMKAASQREGSSWVTTVTAWDGGHACSQSDVNTPLAPSIGTTQQFAQLIQAMGSTVAVGYIDPNLNSDLLRGVSLVGSPWNKIQQMANALYATAFIDLGKVYVISNGSYIPDLTGGLDIISSSTGLLDTPMKQNTKIEFPIIFEPRLKIGQQVILQSIETVNNGSYAIAGLDHVGTISDAVGGNLRTTVYCYYPFAYTTNGAIQ